MKRKLSLKWLAVIFCCLLVIIPSLFSAIYFTTTATQNLEDTTQDNISFYADRYADYYTSLFNSLTNSTYYLMTNPTVQSVMKDRGHLTVQERVSIEEEIAYTFMTSIPMDTLIIQNVYLVKNNGKYFSAFHNGMYPKTTSYVASLCERFREINSARDFYTVPARPEHCFFVVNYSDPCTQDILGKLIVELNVRHLLNASHMHKFYPDAILCLETPDGTIVSPSQSEDFVSLKKQSLENAENTYFHDSRSLSPRHISVHVLVPRDTVLDTIQDAIHIHISILLLVLLITMGIGTIVMVQVNRQMKTIQQQVDLLTNGDMTARMPETPYQETEYMAKAFNHMANRLESLFKEVYERGLLLRDAEFKMLESQIRPHFIFNVLEIINMKCMAAGQHDICEVVSNLAQLLRISIVHRDAQTVPLREELQYVRYYLNLQKERFADQLNYYIDLEDPEILSYYLPRLTIQPLVENSIVHGLENKRGGGSVRISIWEEESELCIRISDDGIGFDSEKLLAQQQKDNPENTAHNHVALSNISRRIQLLYGNEYGMTVHSSPGEGTSILLTLPIDHGQTPYTKESPTC